MKPLCQWLTIAICLTAAPTYLLAQLVEIEGDGRLTGLLDICHEIDSHSIYIGRRAGNNAQSDKFYENTFFGVEAGMQNTGGKGNSFFGHEAGQQNLDGSRNVFVGKSTGVDNADGSDNSFIGYFAGFSNTTGSGNTFVGRSSGVANTSGSSNAFFGNFAGSNNEGGLNNTFIGEDAGFFNANASNNTFIGESSGFATNSGDWNVALGSAAGYINKTGSQNTLIGAVANVSTDNLTNATAIGYNAVVNANNKVRVGNHSVTVIEGAVPFSSTSDRRLKENIQPVQLGLDFISDLNPVQYHRIANTSCDLEMGLIAQELQLTLREYDADQIGTVQQTNNDYMSLRYNDLIAPMIRAIQELNEKVEHLEATNVHLQAELAHYKR